MPTLPPMRRAAPEAVAAVDRLPPGSAERLVASPIFVFSPMRSGSTLLRVILNSHSSIIAPHELHLTGIKVELPRSGARLAVRELSWTRRDLEHMLWDRMLAAILADSGKAHVVSKTPGDTRAWRRISTYWPQARFIFLIRHPASIVESWCESHPALSVAESVERTRKEMEAVEAARRGLSGHTVRYEDLVADPEASVRAVCAYLGVDFEAAMLDYGTKDHGRFRARLGDWREKIATGRIQQGRPLPSADAVPSGVQRLVKAWGYSAPAAEG